MLAPLEGYIKRLRADVGHANAAGLTALVESSALVIRLSPHWKTIHPQMPNSDALAARVAELRDTLPEPEMMHTLFALAEDEAHAATAPAGESVDLPIAVAAEPEVPQVTHATNLMPDDDAALMAALEAIELGEPTATADTAYSLADTEATATGTTDAATIDAAVGAVNSEEDLTAAWLQQFEEEEAAAQVAAASAQVEPVQAEASDQRETESIEPAVKETAELLSFEDLAQTELEPTELAHLSALHEEPAPVVAAEIAAETIEVVPVVKDHGHVQHEDAKPAAATTHAPAPVMQTAPELPPLADDAQPDGKLDLPDIDEDLLEIFVQEAADILDHSDSMMARLRESPQDRDLVTGLQRDLHTLKGGARMAGLAPIGDLSHSMESLLEVISENRRLMDRVTVESLERGFDRLHGLVQRVARRQAIAMPEHAIARFEGLVSGELPAAAPMIAKPSTPEPEATPTAAVPPREEIATALPAAPSATKPNRPPPRPLPVLEEEDTQTRAPQEMIRVRSDLLDSLVNYAGEVSIYRSRLEQQISTFRFNLVEFETTVARLRDQLRKLEMETEAQILSRYQREQHEVQARPRSIHWNLIASASCSSCRVPWPNRYRTWSRFKACSMI